MSSRDYIDAAKERTGVAWLQRMVLDRVMVSDSPAKEVVSCEEVFVHDSDLSQVDWQNILEKLGLWENDARTRMSQYKWIKDQPALPFLEKKVAAEEKKKDEKPKKAPKRRKAEPGPEGGGTEG